MAMLMRSGACQSIVLMLATGIGVNIMQKNIAHRKSLKQCVYGAVACPSRSRVYGLKLYNCFAGFSAQCVMVFYQLSQDSSMSCLTAGVYEFV